jgi:hypothetical protein
MTIALTSNIMPRTTLDLDASVLEDLRRCAAVQGKSMGQVASEQLAACLRVRGPSELPPLNWQRKDMGPFKIDLEDKEAVQRLLDEEEFGAGSH